MFNVRHSMVDVPRPPIGSNQPNRPSKPPPSFHENPPFNFTKSSCRNRYNLLHISLRKQSNLFTVNNLNSNQCAIQTRPFSPHLPPTLTTLKKFISFRKIFLRSPPSHCLLFVNSMNAQKMYSSGSPVTHPCSITSTTKNHRLHWHVCN